MTTPTQFDIEEYKGYAEGSKHPHQMNLGGLKPIIDSLPKTDEMRKLYEQVMRYDRYLELRMLCAPYFYALLLKHGVTP